MKLNGMYPKKYFQSTWIDDNYPIHMWNVFTLDGPHTNNNAEGWHSKVWKLTAKPYLNIYEVNTLLKKAEQGTTEVKFNTVGSKRTANQE